MGNVGRHGSQPPRAPPNPHLMKFMTLVAPSYCMRVSTQKSECPGSEGFWLLSLGPKRYYSYSLLFWITHSGWSQLPHQEDKQLYGAVLMASCQKARIHLTGLCVSHLIEGSPRLLKSSEDCCPGSVLTPIHQSQNHIGCTPPLASSLASSKAKNSISQMHLHHAFYGTWIQTNRKIHVRLRKQK